MLENADLYRAVPRELNLLQISFIVAEQHPFNQDRAFFVECIPDLRHFLQKLSCFTSGHSCAAIFLNKIVPLLALLSYFVLLFPMKCLLISLLDQNPPYLIFFM